MKRISSKAKTLQYQGDLYFNGILMPEASIEQSLTSLSSKILGTKSFTPMHSGLIKVEGYVVLPDELIPEEVQWEDYYVIAELTGTAKPVEPIHSEIYWGLEDFLTFGVKDKPKSCELVYLYNFYLIESELEILELRRKHEAVFYN